MLTDDRGWSPPTEPRSGGHLDMARGTTMIELAAPGMLIDGQRHVLARNMPPREWQIMVAPRWRLTGDGGMDMVVLPRVLTFRRTDRYKIERGGHVYLYELESERELALPPEDKH